MDDLYNTSSVLLIDFDLSPESVAPAFLFATLSYMVILFCNLILILTIVLNKSLHQPMYIILLNLPVNDLIGSSALFPQMFFVHYLGSVTSFMLLVMALDRFIAICIPLRYPVLITNNTISVLCGVAWFIPLPLMMFFVHYLGSVTSFMLLVMALDRFIAICIPLRYPVLITNNTISVLCGVAWFIPLPLMMFFVHYLGSVTSFMLLVMALDRFIAICIPLRYPVLITNNTISVLCGVAWFIPLPLMFRCSHFVDIAVQST
ncbi:hypothetical protein F2P81_016772 [Scophthalmus maximus]|uniref:G-protein coupled receptors family 1 profile domain-containing protein n=1 Tax=Scophthalmus maximus TaxID=52904 RepID=A0A6A4SFV7_SCOMX|nr:hypothetical protein F2P81_016772 [Scophthalmus maximus]